MLDLQLPWWEFLLRAALVYLALLVMVRVTGKRTVGQFTPFDLVVVMLLAEAVSNSLSGGDQSLVGGLLAAGTLVALDVALSFATSRSARLDKLIEGSPVLIARDGVIYADVLKRERVAPSDVDAALREADCDLENLRMAILESDGKISVLKKQQP
jgi:uncharacterized membrane protein YcaP (DUF421 family)